MIKDPLDWVMIRERLMTDYAMYKIHSLENFYTYDSEVVKVIDNMTDWVAKISNMMASNKGKTKRVEREIEAFNKHLVAMEHLFLINSMSK